MKAAENRHGHDTTDRLHRSTERGIFGEREVRADPVIIARVGFERVAKVSLTEHDTVVQALPPHGTDESFRMRILPGRSRCRGAIANERMMHLTGTVRDGRVLCADLKAWFVDHAIKHDAHLKTVSGAL